jgi:hypothetical protein
MKRTLTALLLICVFAGSSYAQLPSIPRPPQYTKPAWTIGVGGVWNLATNDAYGRANYSSQDQVLRDNFGMRWGWGAFVNLKFSPGKDKFSRDKDKRDTLAKRQNRIYLGFDYKGMTNSDFESGANKTSYDIITIGAGYEYVFYGTPRFRSFYGGGLTGNIISGKYTPGMASQTNYEKKFKSSFRVGFELRTGLEVVLNSKRNLGFTVGARYNLMNLFNDDNSTPLLGQSENLSLNDGDDAASGPGFKRYMGMISIDVGLNIYPDVKERKKQ